MDVRVGQEIPTFSRTSGFHAWNRYAGVNDEFVPIHMDDDAGRAAGYPAAFGMGNLQIAYVHAALRQWIGEDGRIVEVDCQMRAANLRGHTTTAGATVTAVHEESGETIVDLDVWTRNDDGTVLTPGTARVVLPAR